MNNINLGNKEKLLLVAQELFSKRGFDAVGTQEICLKAEVSKPVLYHYFGNKRGLLQRVLEEGLRNYLVQLEKLCNYDGDIVASIQAIAVMSFMQASRHVQLFKLYLSLFTAAVESEAYQVALPFREKELLLLENMFLKAGEDHGNMKDRHERYALSLIGMIQSYILGAEIKNWKLDEKAAFWAAKQFMHGIFS